MIDYAIDANWSDYVIEDIKHIGYSIVKNVITPADINEATERMYQVQERILHEVGKERLEKALEIGVLRLMMKYDPYFIKFLEVPAFHEIVDMTISETAIMHLQNGFINPPVKSKIENIFQYQFHRDFPRVLNGYLLSINIMVAISDFTNDNGATLVIPASHQKSAPLSDWYLKKNTISLECPSGSLIIFDSTLWHSAGRNITDEDRLGINHQFVRSYLKQQIDYVRALGKELIDQQMPRVQQLLGQYTRVVTSLDEYYRPEHERLYRKGQG